MKRFRFSGRAAVICSLILALGIPSVAVGFGEGRNLLLGKRNPSSNPALALNSETEIIADNTTFGTRQSNKRDGDGGGAIYGCRSNPGNEPCIRSVNLKGGRAFEFITVGKEGGRIDIGGDKSGAPFTTNATGVATGLNSDKLDGKEAADFAAATSLTFAAISDPGGDATPTAAGPTGPTVTRATVDGNSVYTVDFKRDVSKCSYTAAPVGSPSDVTPGVSAVANQANQVAVNWGNDGGTPTPAPTRGSFHLQVIC
ncbi:hypothetical protein DVA67_031415 [Solirubrobacter sp. CPCC 204708]|uniref:Uncharacterized protein n=1 Tax=Solirubrobacter deserti TaxID=2282478 RepID=A0ABT4RQB8_9ACTN|nr:hypothetical protein [Solirubrobacter deserti]MBE2320514.1 hypothetical protein [Solirubrobacter deserti]MDA0140760.1 hypothetical protein [Solirubrobacter deserti]